MNKKNKFTDIEVLQKAMDHSFYNIYISDSDGKTLYVNKAVERTTGYSKEHFVGKNVQSLAKSGDFYPSAIELVLIEKKEVTILQRLDNGDTAIVSAVPIFNDEGEIELVVTNGRCLNEQSRLIDKQILEYIDRQSIAAGHEGIVYGSEKTKTLLTMIRQISSTDSTVLLLGESGVGKSMYAHHIHQHSKRVHHNFVEICCGAIPGDLLESELFGYEVGAFSGANKTGKPGLAEIADKGTLFLDEIGDMPLGLQVKLLNMIQERKIKRIGGVKEIDVDIRIISATNHNLEDLVSQGKFRKDLYYRINVVPVHIEPLRDRKEDINALIQYFLDKYNKTYLKVTAFNDATIHQLLEYSWPGNVRELQNFIERAVVIGPFGTAIPKDISMSADGSTEKELKKDEPKQGVVVNGIMPLSDMIEEAEGQLIRSAYKLFPSTYKLASALQISQSLAYRKIKKYIKD